MARGHRTIFGCSHKLRMITRWPSPCDPKSSRSPSVTGVLGVVQGVPALQVQASGCCFSCATSVGSSRNPTARHAMRRRQGHCRLDEADVLMHHGSRPDVAVRKPRRRLPIGSLGLAGWGVGVLAPLRPLLLHRLSRWFPGLSRWGVLGCRSWFRCAGRRRLLRLFGLGGAGRCRCRAVRCGWCGGQRRRPDRCCANDGRLCGALRAWDGR